MNSFAVVVLFAAAAAAGPMSRGVYAPSGFPAGLAGPGLVRSAPVKDASELTWALRSGYAPEEGLELAAPAGYPSTKYVVSPSWTAEDEAIPMSLKAKYAAAPAGAYKVAFASPSGIPAGIEVEKPLRLASKPFLSASPLAKYGSSPNPALWANDDEVVYSEKYITSPAFTKFVKYASPAGWADSDAIVYGKKFAAAPAFTKFIASPAFEPAVPAVESTYTRIVSAENEFPVPSPALFKFAPAHAALHSAKYVAAPPAYETVEVIRSDAGFPAGKIVEETVETIPFSAKYAIPHAGQILGAGVRTAGAPTFMTQFTRFAEPAGIAPLSGAFPSLALRKVPALAPVVPLAEPGYGYSLVKSFPSHAFRHVPALAPLAPFDILA